MTPAQIRAGRAYLGWNQGYLAARVGCKQATLSRIEKGDVPLGRIRKLTIAALRVALGEAGIVAIENGIIFEGRQ